MLTDEQVFVAVIESLESLGVPYMLVGSFSTNYYGVPRATLDLDVVVEFDALDLTALVERLGNGFRVEPQMSFEAVTATQRHVLKAYGSSFVVELFAKSNDEHDKLRFANRRRIKMLGRETYLPAVEDVVVTKLRWAKVGARTKDTADVVNILAVRGRQLDWDYLHRWCGIHGTSDLLERLRESTAASS